MLQIFTKGKLFILIAPIFKKYICETRGGRFQEKMPKKLNNKQIIVNHMSNKI
jgi:hypothetical protein